MSEVVKKVLFLSYDGMTDPLGQSQVIPYMSGLAKHGYDISIISFEKNDKLLKSGEAIQKKMSAGGLKWYPLKFHSRPPKISKWWDVQLMHRKARALHQKEKFDIIHCRSYIAAGVGQKLKRTTNAKMLFDMRGFWPDEKADGGNWDQRKFFWRKVYKYYKKKEKEFIRESDALVTLTHTAKDEIEGWDYYDKNMPITVIPCCADEELFTLTDQAQRTEARQKLGIGKEQLVLGYLGSVGAWYMLDDMLLFFKQLKQAEPEAVFLFITNTSRDFILPYIRKHNLSENTDILITKVDYPEVPSLMKASDISISFIKPVYSKKGSSPVKVGETLCMGIPLVANDIGDNGRIINDCNAGVVVQEFSTGEFAKVISGISSLKKLNPLSIREKALEYYSLEKGVQKYLSVYKRLGS